MLKNVICVQVSWKRSSLGRHTAAGSGFGGKGLDRLDKERDAKEKAERKAYGEPDEKAAGEEKVDDAAATTTAAAKPAESKDEMTFGNFKVEVKRGPAPDSSKGLLGVAAATAAARRLAQRKRKRRCRTRFVLLRRLLPGRARIRRRISRRRASCRS